MVSEFESPLWTRVEDALDARRDPIADTRLAADLAAEPRTEAAARRLAAALQALPRVAAARPVGVVGPVGPGASPAPRVPVLVPLLAAAAAIAVTVAAWRGPSASAPDPAFDRLLVYESRIAVERSTPPAPLVRRVVHSPGRVAAWTVSGATRR